MSLTAPAVAEIQGLYGPFSFPEKLLQKIWLRGDFARDAAVTTDGRRVAVLHPGRWNLLGGPDFRGARLRLGAGRELTGDVELHLRAADWVAHAHANDRAYDEVKLHVVLFPPEAGHVTRGGDGGVIPVLALLPLLHHDLEEFAAEEAVEQLAGRAAARIPDELAALGERELGALLGSHAATRWEQKVRYARLRIARLGWDAACHYAALEILGYRFNRAPMLQVATRWPLAEWARRAVDVDAVWTELAESWSLQGVRPANHPRTRLRQYAAWTAARPDWPKRLAAVREEAPLSAGAVGGTREARKSGAFTARRAHLVYDICADMVGGTRFDNVMCDGLLPLLAARGEAEGDAAREAFFFGLWSHWFVGDLPPLVTKGLRELGVFAGPSRPANHGAAQGLLGWLLAREARR